MSVWRMAGALGGHDLYRRPAGENRQLPAGDCPRHCYGAGRPQKRRHRAGHGSGEKHYACGTRSLLRRAEQQCILQSLARLKVKTSSPELAIGRLSGGNQQKAILARCLLLNPRILILDEPTRGIDIGAKYEIYKLINQLVQQGIAVIVISSELPEVLGLSDRVLVMHEGKLKANLINQNLTQEQVMEAALRSERHVEKQSV